VHALEAFGLVRLEIVADEVAEVGPAAQSSPSRISASRARAARVRVLTVPSGMPRNSET